MAALAWATVILSRRRAICVIISCKSAASVCRSLFITITLSATTASEIAYYRNTTLSIFNYEKLNLPSLLERRDTKPLRHESVTTEMEQAQRPIA